MRAAEIEAKARVYLKDHPELHFVAYERATKLGLIAPQDQETILAGLELTRYLCPDCGTDSAKSGPVMLEKSRQ
jgi:hypothetical protein